MMDEKKLPRAVLRENKLYVEGQKGAYVQGMTRSLALEVRDLTYHRGYTVIDGKATVSGRISGTAEIGRGDTIRVAGSNFRAHETPFDVRPVAAGSEHEWRLHIGFLPYNWEICRPGEGDSFFIEVYVTPEAFADLESAYVSGRVDTLLLLLRTTLWIEDHAWHTPPSDSLTWYLVPPEKPSDMPESERGTVESFGWTETPPGRTKPAPVPDEEKPAYLAGARFADDAVRAAQADPEPKKRSWGLVAGWTVFILFCAGYALMKATT